MATAAKTLTRAFQRVAPAASRRATANPAFRQQARRGFSSGPLKPLQSRSQAVLIAVGGAVSAGAYFYYTQNSDRLKDASFVPVKEDYQNVYNAIAKALEERDEYDDGSYGPVLLRLAWHASGTYDKETGTGGSNGATMRFAPEGDHGANAGLKAARDFLEPVKAQYPWITYSDLWTLAGVCAVQEMQGPKIPWRPGRQDRDVAFCSPDGRLPDASKAQDHLRAIFYRMGFDDREIVALSGAHALGRCHTDRSGFSGPWTFSPTVLTNDYFKLLLDEKWTVKKWDGPQQYEDKGSRSLMMLPTDMSLVRDKGFRQHVERYARDNDAFFADFSDVVTRLFELGVPFESRAEDRIRFKSTFEGPQDHDLTTGPAPAKAFASASASELRGLKGAPGQAPASSGEFMSRYLTSA